MSPLRSYALLGFTAVIVDYGAMWVARSQAQSAADAGALAGRTHCSSPHGYRPRHRICQHFAGSVNAVWARRHPQTSTCRRRFGSPVRATAANLRPGRRAARFEGSAPTPTATRCRPSLSLVGLNNQGSRAVGMAQVAASNAVRCIKPWIVADRWIDNAGRDASARRVDSTRYLQPPRRHLRCPRLQATGPAMTSALKWCSSRRWVTFSSGWSLEIDSEPRTAPSIGPNSAVVHHTSRQ